MITKEMFCQSAFTRIMNRQGCQLKYVLTFEEAKAYANNFNNVQVIKNSKYLGAEQEYFFYTDDYCMGTGVFNGDSAIIKNYWGAASQQFPFHTGTNKYIQTLEDYESVFHKNGKRIESMDELLEILNRDFL